ncbi:MAG: STAS domain-containing protein [Fuerstiella sp.]
MSSAKAVFEFERSGNLLIVIPTGSLMEFRDSDVRNAYNETYRLLNEPDVMHLLVDFSQLNYFASTFVGMLIRLARKARQGGGQAVLCNLSDNMKQMMKSLMLLENTKTDFYWVAFPSRDEAIAALPIAAENGPSQAHKDPQPTSETPASSADNTDATAGGGWSRYTK